MEKKILKGFCLYALFPLLCLVLLAGPVGRAVRASDAAAFLILAAALACAGLNWLIYARVRRKRPSLLVFSFGLLCVLAVTLIAYEALPASSPTASTLAVIAGCLALAFMFLLSFWLAARRSKPAHEFAVGLWIAIGVLAFFMAVSVFRDFEIRRVTRDTWITVVILAAIIPAAFARRILSARRITRIIGETRLDMDEDAVTDYHARVSYAVDGIPYEIRAGIRKLTMRRFGKKAFVGRTIPVHYDPENPAAAYADRIDRHFFDRQPPVPEDGQPAETDP